MTCRHPALPYALSLLCVRRRRACCPPATPPARNAGPPRPPSLLPPPAAASVHFLPRPPLPVPPRLLPHHFFSSPFFSAPLSAARSSCWFFLSSRFSACAPCSPFPPPPLLSPPLCLLARRFFRRCGVFSDLSGSVFLSDSPLPLLLDIDSLTPETAALPPTFPRPLSCCLSVRHFSLRSVAPLYPSAPPFPLPCRASGAFTARCSPVAFPCVLAVCAPLLGFSVFHSLVNALIGILTQQGLVPSMPAPIPEWRRAGDPRREIEVEHLTSRPRSGRNQFRLQSIHRCSSRAIRLPMP